ncbi:MAG TPA: inorganic phosphate transporter [archaeon]|nr:inorganic phosphate transporter [archaeon]
MAILLLLVLFLCVALVSGNNLSSCVGTAVGARIISLRLAAMIGICGFTLGLMTLGQNMVHSVQNLLPGGASEILASKVLLSIIAVFILGAILRIPLSFTSSLTGVLTGISIAHGLPIDLVFLSYVVIVWTLIPLVSIAAAFCAMRVISGSKPKDIWSRARTYKFLIVAASFLTAYASGTNTLALVVAIGGFGIIQVSIAIAAIIFGSFFLSAREIKRVGSEMYSPRYSSALVTLLISTALILLASTYSIPLSSTQTLSASVYGAGISHRDRFIATRPFLMIASGWIVAPLLSLGIGLIL